MKLCVIIPAAGSSERFSSGCGENKQDKLAQDLGGRALLLRTVELFTKLADLSLILVAGPPDKLDDFKFKYGDKLAFHGGKVVAGGKRGRWETVKNALEFVPNDCTHIAIHDAARPATSQQLLKRVFEAAEKFDAVTPVIAISSTVKKLGTKTFEAADVDPIAAKLLGDAGRQTNLARQVIQTIDRNDLYETQTPQVFKAELLKQAYAQAGDITLAAATDDAFLVEKLGEMVYAVEGDPLNVKVTVPGDIRLIRAILGVRPPKDRPVHKRF